MSKVFKKVVASMLTIAISLTTVDLISVKAYAKETSDAIKEELKLKETDEEIDAYIDELVDDGKEWEENDEKATTNSITYELVDGIEKTVFYSDDVRYNPKYIASYLEVHGRKYTKYTSMKKIEASRERKCIYSIYVVREV